MIPEDLMMKLSVENDTKMVLVIMDGVGGLEKGGKTALDAAKTPNLDRIARESVAGLTYPIAMGITPGSGPAHIGIFGYDPLKYEIGRGILEAAGVGMALTPRDLAGRGNFATITGGLITDRRAGRIPTEKNEELIGLLSERIKAVGDVEVILTSGREHRFVVVFRGDSLGENLTDADPQKEGLPPKECEALDDGSRRSAETVNAFIDEVTGILKDSHPANTCLLRGLAKAPEIPSMRELFKIRPAAVATYPMYRGLASLVGMDLLETGEGISDEFETVRGAWNDYDYFFVHVKKTDSHGEDGNFDAKVHVIEETDAEIQTILDLDPDVLVVTGDHSTPSVMKSHSWHPNPFILRSKMERRDPVRAFNEAACSGGILGRFQAKEAMTLMLANAGRLEKFGA